MVESPAPRIENATFPPMQSFLNRETIASVIAERLDAGIPLKGTVTLFGQAIVIDLVIGGKS